MSKRARLTDNFIIHTREMRESPAWRALPANARLILDRLELELMRHGGFENGNLAVPYSDFVETGLRRNSIAPAIRQLSELGFIRVSQGKRSISHYRACSLYRLTHVLSRKTGEKHNLEPTNEWRRIKSDEDAAAALKRAAEVRSHGTQAVSKKQKAGGENVTACSIVFDTDEAKGRRRERYRSDQKPAAKTLLLSKYTGGVSDAVH
jgi:hypothetical protein